METNQLCSIISPGIGPDDSPPNLPVGTAAQLQGHKTEMICPSDHFPSTLRNRILPDSCRRRGFSIAPWGRILGKMPVCLHKTTRACSPPAFSEPLLCVQEETLTASSSETSPFPSSGQIASTPGETGVPRDTVWETLTQMSVLCRKFPGTRGGTSLRG